MNDIPTPNAAHLTPIIPQPKPAGIGRNADLTPHQPAPSPSATPRTDAVQTKAEHEDYDVELAMIVSHARQLEREIAERKAERDTPSAVHSCHQSCQRPMCVLRRELAEARETIRYMVENGNAAYEEVKAQRDEWFAVATKKIKELGDAREQRDALAEALREYRSAFYDGPENCSYSRYEIVDLRAEKALAAMKGAADE
jgi:hypothetical protein